MTLKVIFMVIALLPGEAPRERRSEPMSLEACIAETRREVERAVKHMPLDAEHIVGCKIVKEAGL